MDLGVLTLMAGPLVIVVFCAGGLRSYFRYKNRRLLAEPEGLRAQQRRRSRHRESDDQTAPIDLDEMDTNESNQHIARQTRIERVMDRFEFGSCVAVDGRLVMLDSNHCAKDLGAAVVIQESGPQEQLPADEDLLSTNNNSKHDDRCAICLEVYAVGDDLCTGKTENCCHAFHKHCMIDWIESHNRCPICRSNLIVQNEMCTEVV